MTIAVIGAGAIGGVVAAYLKKAGEDVVLVARPDHAAIINAHGLKISGTRGEEVFRVPVLSKMDKAYDLVIFATKTQDVEEAYAHNSDHLENGLVLTTQNGVQADNLLSSHFDQSRQLTSIVMFGATLLKPGEIVLNFDGDWIIGRPFGPINPTTHKTAEVLKKAFNVTVVTDIMGQKYLKLFVNFNNCIPALVGKPMQETFADIDLCRLSILLLREGLDILQTAKIELSSMPQFPVEKITGLAAMPIDQAAQILKNTLTGLSKAPLYGSILQSIMRGKPSEIDFINGEVVQVASHIKMPAPLNTKVVDMVHEVEMSGKYFTFAEVKEAFELAQGRV